jgi:hypothetical protein
LVENPTVVLVVYDGMASFTAEALRQTRMRDPSMVERIVFIGFRFYAEFCFGFIRNLFLVFQIRCIYIGKCVSGMDTREKTVSDKKCAYRQIAKNKKLPLRKPLHRYKFKVWH